MNFFIKRCMEITIVTAVLITIISWNIEQQHCKKINEKKTYYVELIDKSIWDKYGPGAKQPYVDFLSTTVENLTNPTSQENVGHIQSDAELVGSPNAFAAVAKAPEWFNEELDDRKDLLERVKKLIKTGPMIAAPHEKYFATTELSVPPTRYLGTVSRVMGHYAWREWTRGYKQKALDITHDNLKLASTFDYSRHYFENHVGVGAKYVALETIEGFLWSDPDPTSNLRIYNLLKEMESRINASFLYTGYSSWLTSFSRPELLFSVNRMAVAALMRDWEEASETGNQLAKEAAALDAAIAALVPHKEQSLLQAASYLNQWTTPPAMRKRAQKVAPALYENDPLISQEFVKGLPPLLYAACRLREPLYGKNKFYTRMKAKYYTLTAAFWVRCWKDGHDDWPTEDEFKKHCPFAKHVYFGEIHDDPDPRSSMKAYSNLHWEKLGVYNLIVGKLSNLLSREHYVDIAKDLNPVNTIPGRLVYGCPWLTNHLFQPTTFGYKPDIKEMAEWKVEMLKSMTPLFQNVQIQFSRVSREGDFNPSGIEIQLEKPSGLYYIGHQGVDGDIDGPNFLYNRYREPNDNGDIIQIAGWDLTEKSSEPAVDENDGREIVEPSDMN